MLYMAQVIGFDMVDDESKPERRPTKHVPLPADWNSKHNCAYSYYCYYIYANLYTLNKVGRRTRLYTFPTERFGERDTGTFSGGGGSCKYDVSPYM